MLRILLVYLICIIAWNLLSPPASAQGDELTRREKALKLTAEGVTQYSNGNRDTAKRLLLQAIQEDAAVYEAHFWLGRIYAEMGETSQQARRNAIEQFRAAVQLQPYGDEGDLSRAWLLKLAGRPKGIIFVPIRQNGQTSYDDNLTGQLINQLGGRMQKSSYQASVFQDNWQNRYTHPPQKADVRQFGLGDDGVPRAGWVVFIGANRIDVNYKQQSKSYVGSGSADLWVGDAVSETLYPMSRINASSQSVFDLVLKTSSDWQSAQNATMNSLVSLSSNYLEKIMQLENDPQLLNEILVPLPGDLYARSTAKTLQEARQRPTLAMHALGPEDDLSIDVMKKINGAIQRHLLNGCQVNCISPSYTRAMMDEAPDDPEQAAHRLLNAAQCDLALILNYTSLSVSSKQDFLGISTTVTANFTVDAALVSATKGLLWHTPVTIKSSESLLLAGDAVDKLLQLRANCTAKVMSAVQDLLTKSTKSGQLTSGVPAYMAVNLAPILP